jgi:hypothetical protein
MITGATFITRVKAKMNRIDTSSHEDVRPEEVLFFGNDALKALTLEFDTGKYSPLLDKEALNAYLSDLTSRSAEITLTAGKVALPSLLKIKGMQCFVTAGDSTGWVPCIDKSNLDLYEKEHNPFKHSFANKPHYRLEDENIIFDTDGTFSVSKIVLIQLDIPTPITISSELNYEFISELENKTVTLLLENLESRRIETQPVVSKM